MIHREHPILSFLYVLGISVIFFILFKVFSIGIVVMGHTSIFTNLPNFPWIIASFGELMRGINGEIYLIIYKITGIKSPAFFAICIAPIIEEIQFRGPLWALRNNNNWTLKISLGLILTFLFASCHLVPVVYVVFIFLVGCLCSYLTLLTHKLWPSMLFHACYNANIVFSGF